MLNSRAYQKPSTVNPSTSEEASMISIAFITNKNKPRVKMVNGIVRITRIGFNNTFRIEIIMAAIKALVKESTATPGNR